MPLSPGEGYLLIVYTPEIHTMPIDESRVELLIRIASMYFEQGLTQKDIADLTGYSRSMVSRLLAEAREQELVEIRIHHPIERRLDLEQALQERFDLKAVRVGARGMLDQTQMTMRLGALSARLVEELVTDGMVIGLSWGTTLRETIDALRPKAYSQTSVVQMVGLLSTNDPQIDGNELARRLARALGGRYSILPAPLIVDSEATRLALLEDQRVRRVLDMAQKAQLALLGIGTLELEDCTLLHDGFFDETQVAELVQAGAVGDVCCIFLNRNGGTVDTPLARRVVAIDRESLAAIPIKIGVAGGHSKILPILAAICAGLVNVLVTDEVAAVGLLDAASKASSRRPAGELVP